eukprot:CAMPEP_0179103600 /NCGR_PEP_ID=MMETSP0796-20121207/48013_1 /TAXON_ID=73915 /ORGANISM="Pyrodinium bahamense, Strain pbaha01" /LENGTH=281 /DNA_ID=CAMNT_0020801515 /DNA_START=31 /DNA_END=877 /DNA_ORIENTATION=-
MALYVFGLLTQRRLSIRLQQVESICRSITRAFAPWNAPGEDLLAERAFGRSGIAALTERLLGLQAAFPHRGRHVRGAGTLQRGPQLVSKVNSHVAREAQAKDVAEHVRPPLAPEPLGVGPLEQPRNHEVQLAAAERHAGMQPRDAFPLLHIPARCKRQVSHGLRPQPDADGLCLRGQCGGEVRNARRKNVQDDMACLRGDDSAHLHREPVRFPPVYERRHGIADAGSLLRGGGEEARHGDVRRVQPRLVHAQLHPAGSSAIGQLQGEGRALGWLQRAEVLR